MSSTKHHSTFIGRLSSIVLLAISAISFGDSTSGQDAAAVSLQNGTWEHVQAIVRKNQGKVVVVDIWSTSCLPCMKEFPKLVALQKQSPSEIVCISFNVDYIGIKSKPVDTYRAPVEKFLKKNSATFTNILSTTESDEIFASLDLASIPAVYVYGRDGKLAKRFDDSLFSDGEEEAFTYEDDINPFVNALLKASANE
ncbi:MAG: TlpA family protein disulfide reductase [Planctomycetaceae bacterium]|nr:TlpA family protein disulfide reductase [Planctomycetaceae bacterium]